MAFLRCCTVALLSLLVLALQVAAETYPERVIRIVNPFPPGGSVDVTARILAQKLSENLGQQVIVENRAGAGGNTGADSVAKAEADGYTLLFTAPGPLVISDALYQGPAVRSNEGFRAGGAVRRGADRADGASRRGGTERAGTDRSRQGAARQHQLRVRRQRFHQSPRRRDVQEHGQDRHRPCALSRRGAGHE